MALGTCAICTENPAKYKCPKCTVEYCSLPCFKNEKHAHTETLGDTDTDVGAPKLSNSKSSESLAQEPPLLEKIANDPIIRKLLSYKSLQVHISVLLKLLSDSSLTREPIFDNRKEIVNMRLCDLRIGGSEENELVEEFVQRVLFLQGSVVENNG